MSLAAAQVNLLRPGLVEVPGLVALARSAVLAAKLNLAWAFAYNAVGIPLAAGLLEPFTGWALSPVFASAAMSLSSVSVLLNSLRLRRWSP